MPARRIGPRGLPLGWATEEPGIGKTRLAEEFAAWAAEGALAYAPVVTWPRALRSDVDGVGRGHQTVRITEGAGGADRQTTTELRQFRGMNGDLLASGSARSENVVDHTGRVWPDDPPYAGLPRGNTTSYDTAGRMKSTVDAKGQKRWRPDAARVRRLLCHGGSLGPSQADLLC